MGPALALLGGDKLREFFHGIGVPTVVHDGFRVWPETRKSTPVLAGLLDGIERLGVEVALHCDVQRTGDLIFTRDGIRGPVVLDMSRDIAQLLEKHESVPIWMNLCRGKTQDDWQAILKGWRAGGPRSTIECLRDELPLELAEVMCELSGVDPEAPVQSVKGEPRDLLCQAVSGNRRPLWCR